MVRRSSQENQGQTPILKGKVICFSGLGVEEKEAAKKRVVEMGGTVWPSLTDNVDVVIARDLATLKCITAIQRFLSGEQQTAVVGPSWLENCWKEQKFVDPSDYRLKLFGNEEKVGIVGFDKAATNDMREALELLGGTFSEKPDSKCTVLIAKQLHVPKSAFAIAKKNAIPVVRKSWLDSCLSECKNHPKDKFLLASTADEAAHSQSTQASHSTPPMLSSQEPSNNPVAIFGSFLHPEESCSQFSFSQGFSQGLSQGFEHGEQEGKEGFLDGFKIFIAKDISDADCKELRILCRQAGATTVSRDSRNLPSNRRVTHILTAASHHQKEHEDILEVCDRSPPVLQQAWLRESCRGQCLLPIAGFEVVEQQLPVRAHSASSSQEQSAATQGGGAVQRKVSGSFPAVKLLGTKPASASSLASEKQSFKPVVPSRTSEQLAGTKNIKQIPDPDLDPISEDPGAAFAEQSANMFVGHTFEIQIADEQVKLELQKMIKQHGGKVQEPPKRPTFGHKPVTTKSTALQYKVVEMDAPEAAVPQAAPVLGRKPQKSDAKPQKGEVKRVSEYWVRKCAAAGVLFPPSAHSIYAPLKHALPLAPLSELCLCMTGTTGQHRKIVSWLLDKAGVQVKDILKKKTTHLLVAQTSDAPSKKQSFADQHGIPQVSLAWIEACVAAGMPVDVTPDLAPTCDPFHSPAFSKPSPRPAGFEVDAAFAAMAARDSQSRKRPLEMMTRSAEKSPAKRIDFESSSKKPLDFTRVGGASPAGKRQQQAAQHSIPQPDFEAVCFVQTRQSPPKPSTPPEAGRSPVATRRRPSNPPTPAKSEPGRSPAKGGAVAAESLQVSKQAEPPSASPGTVRAGPARSPIMRGVGVAAPAAALAAEEEFIPDTDEETEEGDLALGGRTLRSASSELSTLLLVASPTRALQATPTAASVQTPQPQIHSPGLRSVFHASGVSPGLRSKTAASPKIGAAPHTSGAPEAGCDGSSMASGLSTLDPTPRDVEMDVAALMAASRSRAGGSLPEMLELQKVLDKRTQSGGPVLHAPSASKRKRTCTSPRAAKSPRSPRSVPSASAGGLSPAPQSPPGSRTRSSGTKVTPPTKVGKKREGRSSNQSSQEADGEDGEEEDGAQVEVDCTDAEQQRKLQLESARKHHQQTLRSQERQTTRFSQGEEGEEEEEEKRVLRSSQPSQDNTQTSQNNKRPARSVSVSQESPAIHRVAPKRRRRYGNL